MKRICYYCRKREPVKLAMKGQLQVKVCEKCAKSNKQFFDEIMDLEKGK